MTREEVESILEELGWVNTRKELTSEDNDSVYVEWINAQEVEVFVGNYYLEIETQGTAYPYKDTCSTRQEVIEYLLK
jgi:hypothetical protein